MRRVRRLVLVAIGCIAISCASADEPVSTFITDSDLKIWRNEPSPNGNSRIVIYQHDMGALGYGRVISTVTPANIDGLDLARFKLPDAYRAEGWTNESDLQVSKWNPYYYLQDFRELHDGDFFNGVKVKLVENNSEYELPGYEEPSSNR
ncbi:MAG: hypothetical protein WBD22_05070 [Pyrinomonadaceae bacterium]